MMKSSIKKLPPVIYETNGFPQYYEAKYKNYLINFRVWKKHTNVIIKHDQRKDFFHHESFLGGVKNGYCVNKMFDFVCDKIDNDISLGHQYPILR